MTLDTATLEEVDGKTLFVSTSVFQSVEDRDAYVKTGATEGGTPASYADQERNLIFRP